MSTLSFTGLSTARHREGAHPGRISAFFGILAAEWRARRAMRRIDSLSDEMLHDIGLTRGEIDSAVRYGRSRRG